MADPGRPALDARGVRLLSTLSALRAPCEYAGRLISPRVVTYLVRPDPGVRASRISRLATSIAVALAVPYVRIVAPYEGTDAIGIEVPRDDPAIVSLADVMVDPPPGLVLPIPIGIGTDGRPIIDDLARMPHLLVAGATGSGKSVFINGAMVGLLSNSPARMRLALIDLKRVELAPYAGLPHVIGSATATDAADAVALLHRVANVMETRYRILADRGAHNVEGTRLTRIVVVVDELADLVLSDKSATLALVKLAQKGRAAGIHLILATQRPSVDVVAGILKANMPARLAFALPSGTDSRTILDVNGAERLLGRGDMLYRPPWRMIPARVQAPLVTPADVSAVVARWPPRPPRTRRNDPTPPDSIVSRVIRLVRAHPRAIVTLGLLVGWIILRP